jgi:hypothetical protein
MTNSIIITEEEYLLIDECICGGPVFKFINSSKNISIVKCGYITHEYDIKKKEMVKSKRQPCNFYGTTQTIESIETSENIQEVNKVNKVNKVNEVSENDKLRNYLKLLFEYLVVSKKRITLQLINNIVKNKLLRKINTNYINSPNFETFEDYYKRIFSRPIEIRKQVILPVIKKNTINYLINKDLIPNIKKLNINKESDFIEDSGDYSDADSESENEEGSQKEYESDTESELIKETVIIDDNLFDDDNESDADSIFSD